MIYEIYRLLDAKKIGTVEDVHPFKVRFTNQAGLEDKDYLNKLFSSPHRTRLGFSEIVSNPEGEEEEAVSIVSVTEEHTFQSEDDQFFLVLLGDLPMKGFLALEKKED